MKSCRGFPDYLAIPLNRSKLRVRNATPPLARGAEVVAVDGLLLLQLVGSVDGPSLFRVRGHHNFSEIWWNLQRSSEEVHVSLWKKKASNR